jgi:Rrf2 family nitric oxide-sensitive transcriptional repressor
MYTGLNRDRLSTITEIAQHFRISKSHLMKVVSNLAQLGYLETVRGKNGGLRLMLSPAKINIGAVVRATEEELDIIGCLQESNYCSIQGACVLRGALRRATDAFLAVLDQYSLEDLLLPGKALAKMLDIGWVEPVTAYNRSL